MDILDIYELALLLAAGEILSEEIKEEEEPNN